jgi:hypothetical protein
MGDYGPGIGHILSEAVHFDEVDGAAGFQGDFRASFLDEEKLFEYAL